MTVTTRATDAATPWARVWEWIARPLHYRAVRELRVAAETGDERRLEELLDPHVAVVVESRDPGGSGARVAEGVGNAIPLLVHGMGARADRSIEERSVNGQAGLLLRRNGEADALVSVDFTGSRVSVVWVRLHPEVLRHGNRF